MDAADLPGLPAQLTRNTVDRHYTVLVDALRVGGSPAQVADQAKAALIDQYRAAFPGADLPAYIRDLGNDPDSEEDLDAPLENDEPDTEDP